jgi:hypothetical protein
MLEMNEAVRQMLEEDYENIKKKCHPLVVESIKTLDERLFSADQKSSGIFSIMKTEIQFLEVCSNDNCLWTGQNLHVPFAEINFERLMENFEAHHGNDDFRIRWQGMIFEMATHKNCKQTTKRFGNPNPGPLELFLNYRIVGMPYTYRERHDDEFTFPGEWGEVPDIGETKLIQLIRIYEKKK